jgi:class 3 adenylate cyclase
MAWLEAQKMAVRRFAAAEGYDLIAEHMSRSKRAKAPTCSSYTAIGTVCNLASRRCAAAKDGQILVSQRVAAAVEATIALEDCGSLALKGRSQPISAFNAPLEGGKPAAIA